MVSLGFAGLCARNRTSRFRVLGGPPNRTAYHLLRHGPTTHNACSGITEFSLRSKGKVDLAGAIANEKNAESIAAKDRAND
jgi:hypothetical protein